MKVYDPALLQGAPEGFRAKDFRAKELPGHKLTIQVSPDDCTGCAVCVNVCPAKSKTEVRRRAIGMEPAAERRDVERANWQFFDAIPRLPRDLLPHGTVKGSQLLEPLFEFSGACAGCGETPYVKLVSQLFGDRLVVANSTGCSSMKAETAQAQAQLAQAEADRADLTVLAPFSGTVLTRAAEPGEVVQAGTAIVTLLDLSKVYLRGFVPEGGIGKVKVGQPAHIFLDSNPNNALDGYVLRIDPQATFTPENTYFRDDRVKQVVGVKVQLTQGIGFAKPGMPADGEILTNGNTWPRHKRAAQ